MVNTFPAILLALLCVILGALVTYFVLRSRQNNGNSEGGLAERTVADLNARIQAMGDMLAKTQ